ncbi:hypothetical protein LDO32_17865 [Luteimonas sp. Y-2-2-4F]|nr:hypothetical protein [Luteimonas sp. Y-2-2-4F]MCD9033583.1 hypothetical protein [Luteimonas sp. Y-2-2-4F]
MQNILKKGALKKQPSGQCVPHHMRLARIASGIEGKGWKNISHQVPTKIQVVQSLMKGPCVLLGNGITKKGSNYKGHHAVTLLQMADDDKVIVVDCDDTVGGEELYYETDLEALLRGARPPYSKNLDGDDVQVDAVLRQPQESSSWCSIM